jgi:hypothetical protein
VTIEEIERVKAYRNRVGCSLREARRAVEDGADLPAPERPEPGAAVYCPCGDEIRPDDARCGNCYAGAHHIDCGCPTCERLRQPEPGAASPPEREPEGALSRYMADGRETLEFIAARLSQDQYAALHNALEAGRIAESRALAAERERDNAREALRGLLATAPAPFMPTSDYGEAYRAARRALWGEETP